MSEQNNDQNFDLKQLLENEVTLNDGRKLPLFIVICQTGINSTAWKGADLEKVNLVKKQLDDLYKYLLAIYPEAQQEEEPQDESGEEEGVGIADGVDQTQEQPQSQKKADKKKQ